MKHGHYILFSLLVLLSACTHEPEWNYSNTKRGNIEALWNIIDKKYCFVEEKGVNWDSVLPEYLERVDSVNSYMGLFDLMAQMLDLLQDGHVNLYSDFDISRCRTWYEGYPDIYDGEDIYGEQYLGKNYRIAGGIQYNKTKDGRVGVIRYSSFSNGFSAINMLWVLEYLADCEGIVLDVRSNGGGNIETARSLASTFFTEPRKVGYWSHKIGERHYEMSKPEEMIIDTTEYSQTRWTKPVVVVCDRESYSATNYFVNAMRYADRCTTIGVRTGGGGGMPLSYELPCGWMVRFSAVKMYDTEMHSIEEGIEPDVLWETSGVLEQAVDLILKKI